MKRMKRTFAQKEKDRLAEIALLREEVIDKCFNKKGNCSKTENVDNSVFCKCWLKPSEKWRLGDCNSADLFLRTNFKEDNKRVRVGQQKTKRKNR
jgi:hypothetical protein